MKTKLSPLLTAFDALDLALRVAGVVGGLAAIATHFSQRPAAADAPATSAYVAQADAFRAEAMQARVEAAMARAHATHAGTRVIRVHLEGVPTPPVQPVASTDGDGD